MSWRNWYRDAAPWIAAVVYAAVATPFIGQLAIQHYKHTLDLRYAAERDAERTDDQILQECAAIVPADMRQRCIVEGIEAKREGKRADYDLVAQQTVADLTFWVVIVSVAQAIIGSVVSVFTVWGVFLVRDTLKASQEAAASTREIGQAQVRAYITYDGMKLLFAIEDGAIKSILIQPVIKNVGQSPAFIVSSYSYIAIYTDPLVLAELGGKTSIALHVSLDERTKVAQTVGTGSPFNLAQLQAEIRYLSQAFRDEARIFIFGLTIFRDIFYPVTKERQIDFCYEIMVVEDPATLDEITASELNRIIQPWAVGNYSVVVAGNP